MFPNGGERRFRLLPYSSITLYVHGFTITIDTPQTLPFPFIKELQNKSSSNIPAPCYYLRRRWLPEWKERNDWANVPIHQAINRQLSSVHPRVLEKLFETWASLRRRKQAGLNQVTRLFRFKGASGEGCGECAVNGSARAEAMVLRSLPTQLQDHLLGFSKVGDAKQVQLDGDYNTQREISHADNVTNISHLRRQGHAPRRQQVGESLLDCDDVAPLILRGEGQLEGRHTRQESARRPGRNGEKSQSRISDTLSRAQFWTRLPGACGQAVQTVLVANQACPAS